MAMTSRRNLLVVAVLVVAVGIAFAVLRSGDSGDDAAPGGTPSAPGDATTAPTSPSDVVRATGPGSCAFLSTDDVRAATGAAQVELRQSLGPNGNPGCEWMLGDERRILQLEFQPGRAPANLPEGDDVPGPWRAARWVASSRTLYVDANGLALFLRATDNDPGRARDACTAVGALVAERN